MTKESHAHIAAELIVNGCIPYVAGTDNVDLPVKGTELSREERGKLLRSAGNHLNEVGTTFFYPVGGTGVLCDLSPGAMSVWFQGGNSHDAIQICETELKRTYPGASFLEERAHPEDPGLRVRFYQVELENNFGALVEASFPVNASAAAQFAARVVPLRKKNSRSANREPITPASLTAFLAVNTLVPMILGELSQRTPAIGKPLNEQQRRELGLRPGGTTVVYELNEGAVVMDLVLNTATVSFANGDAATAMATFDRIVSQRRPSLRQIEDVRHPRGGRRRLRVYEGDLGGGLLCRIEADYPSQGATDMDNRFVVRVSAFERRGS